MRKHLAVVGKDREQRYTELVGDKIRGVLAEKHRTQAQLAAVLRISQQSVSKRLNGEVPWDVDELFETASWLEVPISTFIVDRKPAPPASDGSTYRGTTGDKCVDRYLVAA